jgi:alpha-beta hydrolase superfamily lysophospholipase
VLAVLALRPPPYTPRPAALPDSFETFLADRLAESRAAGVWPGAEERLVRRAPGRTPWAILYVHGFGASRGEGELVADSVSALLGANLYYLRLPGHATNLDDHARHEFDEYLDVADAAFRMTRRLGERVIVMGTSTGALLATWLAARHPDDVVALVLASPFYAFHDPTSAMIALPGGMRVIEARYGRLRDSRDSPDPERRRGPGREKTWLLVQRYAALRHLDRLRRHVARPETYARVTAPTLMFYYWRDSTHRDSTASVAAMRSAFAALGGARRSPLNRAVAVADGEHVLFSAHVRTDKALVFREIAAFLERLGALPAAGPRQPGARVAS